MKTWLAKLKISSALDDRKPLPPDIERPVAESEELRRFADNSADLDQGLKNSRPDLKTSASLHAAIMRAVRAAEPVRAPAFDWQKIWGRWIPATALASLILLVFFAVSHNSHRSELPAKPAALSTFADASSAVETGGKLVRELPDAALSPLNDERLRLNRDLANAQKFLLASLP